MFLSMLNATFTLLILAATSTFVPPGLSITLPRYVQESTYSNRSPSTVTGFSLMVLILMNFDLPLLIFCPILFDAAASLVVLLCICSWLCERRARSSAKSKSSSCEQRVHWIPYVTRQAVHSHGHSHISRSFHVFSHYLLNLVVANLLQ